MQFKLNPITGDIDRVSGNGNYIQKINPVTGKFNLVDDASSYKQIINPLTGNFQLWALGWGWWDIPEQYAVLEYIESTGTQWIDLGISLKNTDDIEVILQHTLEQAQSWVFGWRENASGNNISIIVTQTWNRLVTDFNNSSYAEYRYIMPSSMMTSSKYKIILNKNERVIYDWDTLVWKNVTTNSDTISTPWCYLFTTYWYNSYNFIWKIYSVKIWNRMNLVPVMRTDHTVWMFDTVSQTFFANSWTWEFTAWPFAIPEQYTKDEYFSCPELPYVWYVWINTWILPKYDMDIYIDYSVYNSSSVYVFWARERWWTQHMTFSWSQNWGTITSYVWGNYVAAQTGSTKWARVANQENRYSIAAHIDSEHWNADITFNDLINERTDNQNFTFTPEIFETNQVPMYIWWNWREPETSTTRIHEANISWEENGQLNVRVFMPVSHWDRHWFYEIFTKQFLHY